jgi:DNA-binding transcriptional ArsR family regulator
MVGDPDVATLSALIGEPARAAILLELMTGRALTASELAVCADVSASTASEHLARLVDGGLLTREAQGRHRYYRLASPRVARVLESLATLARPAPPANAHTRELQQGFQLARTCYDHLAGRLGVAVLEALLAGSYLAEHDGGYRVTQGGETWFAAFGVDVDQLRRARRAFARRCLDCTERRPHLAGALGKALLGQLLDRRWLERLDGERMLVLTSAGEAGLRAELGLHIRVESGTLARAVP